MPVDIKQIRSQLDEMGKKVPVREAHLSELRTEAVALLKAYANKIDVINECLINAKSKTKSLRCAIPFTEALYGQYPLPGSIHDFNAILLAADGSQVNPDRHSEVEFGVINVGAYRIKPGSRQAPREFVHSQLLYHDDLYTPSGPIGEEIVALRRDLNERMYLATLVKEEAPEQVLALTDGPLELFREPSDQRTYQRYLEDYICQLKNLSRLKAIVAGYVDRPRSDLVVRLLELIKLANDEPQNIGKVRPFYGLFDYDLFIDLLGPDERTAIFGIESRSAASFEGNLALHFFYLNVGLEDQPYLARVEIPQWVAQNENMVDQLHLGLIQQCRQMGLRPYPYGLHRAHEVALVTLDEKRQLQDMVIRELLKQGINIFGVSHKQFAKDISGKQMRYK